MGNESTAVATAQSTAVDLRRPVGNTMTLRKLMAERMTGIKEMLNGAMKPERMVRLIEAAARGNGKLQECTGDSWVAAIVKVAEFGLEPNTPLGQAFLIPYAGKVELQVGYQGLIELAYRSPRVETIYAEAVYPADKFEIRLGVDRNLIHVPAFVPDRGDPIGYYAVIKVVGKSALWVYMTHDEIMRHARKYSKAYNYDLSHGRTESRWSDPPSSTGHMAMCKKTVIIQACKTAPKSLDDKFSRAVADAELDDAIDVKAAPSPVATANSLDALTAALARGPENDEPEEVDPDTGEVLDVPPQPQRGPSENTDTAPADSVEHLTDWILARVEPHIVPEENMERVAMIGVLSGVRDFGRAADLATQHFSDDSDVDPGVRYAEFYKLFDAKTTRKERP